jgi:hypothetical protein
MGVSRYGFTHAWSLLKALPGQRGYMGTLPPSLTGMLERGREQGGVRQPRLDAAGNVIFDDSGRMVTDMVTDEEGNVIPVPRVNRMVERDLSPITEDYEAMLSSGFQGAAPKTTSSGNKTTDDVMREIKPNRTGFKTQMQNVSGFRTEPEEGFFTGREKFLARQGLESAARRQLTGGQRGGRMDVRGGSQSGINKPLRGRADDPTTATPGGQGRGFKGEMVNPRATRRSPSTLSNQEGIGVRAKLGGASAEFLEEEPEPSEEERLANMLREMGMDVNVQTGGTAQPTEPARGKPYKSRISNDELMQIEETLTAIHGPEMASRIVQSMIDDPQPPAFRTAGVPQRNLDPQGDRPNLGRIMQGGPDKGQFRPAFLPDEATQAMLGGGAEGQAALQQRLMDLAASQGAKAGRGQTQIDRQA